MLIVHCKFQVSPKCPMGHGDSETGFKSSLIRYLNTYQVSALKPYINAINMTNFASVNR